MNNEEKIIAMLEEHGKLLAEQGKLLSEQGKRLDKLENDVQGVRILVDVDIDKKLNLLAEGHTSIIEQLIPVSRVAVLEDDMAVVKEAIKALSIKLRELEEKSA